MRLEDFFGVDVDLDEVARWARDGDNLEVILTRLRDMGCEVVGCIAVLNSAGVMPMSEGKAAVVFSETWKDELRGTWLSRNVWVSSSTGRPRVTRTRPSSVSPLSYGSCDWEAVVR